MDIQREWCQDLMGGGEENVINVCGIPTLPGKTGAHILLHYDSEMWHSIVQAGNLETRRSEVRDA